MILNKIILLPDNSSQTKNPILSSPDSDDYDPEDDDSDGDDDDDDLTGEEEDEDDDVTLTPLVVVPTLTAVKSYPCWRPGMDMPGHEVNQVRKNRGV